MQKNWLPCLFTLLNLASGILAIIFTIKGNISIALIMIFFSIFFDAIDGRVARKFNATSEFGKELDSLADLVSFGIVPGLILYANIVGSSKSPAVLEYILPAVFILCGAIRLARYNVLNIKDHFVGVPIPMAGGLLLLALVTLKDTHPWIILWVTLGLSILMVSNLKLPRLFS